MWAMEKWLKERTQQTIWRSLRSNSEKLYEETTSVYPASGKLVPVAKPFGRFSWKSAKWQSYFT